MSRHRFFLVASLPEAVTGQPVALPLSDEDVHHAIDVLRIGPREEIVVVEPNGEVSLTEVETVAGRQIIATVASRIEPGPPLPRLTLIQGVAKGQTMDDIVQHAVELGVERVVPLITGRTIVRFDPGKAESRAVRWRSIAEGAARQSQQSRVPVVDLPRSMTEAVALAGEFDAVLVMWEESAAPGVAEALRRAGVDRAAANPSVAIVVGPEGGLAAAEVRTFADAGAIECSLGPSILRVETAALAAVVLTSSSLGGLGSAQRAAAEDLSGD